MPNQGQKKQNKKSKHPEVEDFFTVFLAKKNRNLKKKLDKISELEVRVKNKEELKKEQLDMIQRKSETQDQIDENDKIKACYLEAYSKKDENEPAKPEQEAQAEVTQDKQEEKPQVNEEEVELRGVNVATDAIAKLMVVGHLLNNKSACQQFADQSNNVFTCAALEEMNELSASLFDRKSGNNWDKYQEAKTSLTNFAISAPLLTAQNKPYSQFNELIDKIAKSDVFTTFAPVNNAPKVQELEASLGVPQPTQVTQQQTTQQAPKSVRKDSEKSKTKSRKESEAQQDVFMENSDDEDTEQKPTEQKPAEQVQAVQEKQPLQEKPQSSNQQDRNNNYNNRKRSDKQNYHKNQKPKEDAPKKEGDDDEDEWFTAQRGPRQNDGGNRGRGGHHRGGRGGDRGRGNWRGGNREGGDKRPQTQGADGEFRKDREGWRGGRGDRRGGRGRGGRGGRGGNDRDGNESYQNTFLKKGDGSENVKPNGEPQPERKEVGAAPQQTPIVAAEN